MYIEKIGNKWRIRPIIDKKRHTITFDYKPTKFDIAEAISQIKNKKNSHSETFFEISEKMLSSKDNVLSPSTLRRYNTILKGISEDFKQKTIDDIDNVIIQEEINRLAGYLSPKTVRNYYGFISSVFSYIGIKNDFRVKLPAKQIKPVYIPKEEDIKALLEYTRENKWANKYLFPILCGIHGMRLEEVTALTEKDIDVDKRLIYINKGKVLDKNNQFVIKETAKTDKSNRVIKVTDELILAYKENGLYAGYPKTISDYMRRTQDKLGLERFSFHKLRHYFASIALEELPMELVKEYGGWSSNKTLNQVYAHNLRSLDDISDFLDKKLS